ncbi:MAG: hypothetical protein M3397_04785 [Actinomycetota bacterium]|nr:hypothetical protein [Actinomycetota bacterium]
MMSTITPKAIVTGMAANCAKEDKKVEMASGLLERKVRPESLYAITANPKEVRTSSEDFIRARIKR